MRELSELVVLGLRGGAEFAKRVHANLNDSKLGSADIGSFNNGEIKLQIGNSIRGKDVYVVQNFTHGYEPDSRDINADIVELFLAMDALKRAGPERIVAVLPHLPYCRQDKKKGGREPISARWFADTLQSSTRAEDIGLSRVITVEPHSDIHEGFYNCPMDKIKTLPLISLFFKSMQGFDPSAYCAMSPDANGAHRASVLAKELGCSYGMVDKDRVAAGEANARSIAGDYQGKHILWVDDMIDTAGSMETGKSLIEKLDEFPGRKHYAACTHLVASKSEKRSIFTEQFLYELGIRVVATNSIPRSDDYRGKAHKWLRMLDLAPYVASVIQANHQEESVSDLLHTQLQAARSSRKQTESGIVVVPATDDINKYLLPVQALEFV